jgi:hypothetical protein
MSYQDLKNNTKQLVALPVSTINSATPVNGNEIDRRGFGSLTFAVGTGTITAKGTSNITFEIQETNTSGSGYTAVADDDLIGLESVLTVDNNADDNIIEGTIGYIGTKRYVRIVATGSSDSNGVVFATAILGSPDLAPVVQP